MKKFIDLTGRQFGRLVVVECSGKDKSGHKIYLCKCDCGKSHWVLGYNLKNGTTNSCGCLVTENAIKNLNYIHVTGIKPYNKDRFDGTRIGLLTAKKRLDNTSGHKGVSWSNSKKKWVAQINIKKAHINLGCFSNINDAITARKEAEEKYFKPVVEEYKLNKGGDQ